MYIYTYIYITRWVCVCDRLLNTGCDITQWWPTFLTKGAEFVILIISACMYVSLWLTGLTTLWFITLPPNGSPPMQTHHSVCVRARASIHVQESVCQLILWAVKSIIVWGHQPRAGSWVRRPAYTDCSGAGRSHTPAPKSKYTNCDHTVWQQSGCDVCWAQPLCGKVLKWLDINIC